MPQRDSIDKIVEYFACVTAAPFSYKDKTYLPRILRVSPDIARGYTCPSMCGGCCSRFSLDYLPSERQRLPEEQQKELSQRVIIFNNQPVCIFSDTQPENNSTHCKHLTKNGRCAIHLRHPFSCDFELTRFMLSRSVDTHANLTTKLYGRGWNMLRVDGERGAKCSMLPPTYGTLREVIRKLDRLQEWATHFGLKETYISQIHDWVIETKCCDGPLIITPQ